MVSFVIGKTAYCGTGTNGTNLKDFWSYNPTLSVDEQNQNSPLKVYPNPSQSNVNFNIGNNNEVFLEIYDATGRNCFTTNFIKSYIFDRQNLTNGVYYYVITNNDTNFSGKFVLN
jgi:hypothetical protein